MSIFAQFETNKEAEKKGAAVTYAANDDGTIPTFYVSRMSRSNKNYLKALDRNAKPHRRSIDLETIKPEVADSINLKVFVDSILLGWENIKNKDGEIIQFNKENAISLFESLPDLYDDLSERARKASTFRDEEIEEEAKN